MSEGSKKQFREVTRGKKHCPALSVDYGEIDSDSDYGDAIYMDIGQSAWNKEDFSAKIWRRADNGQRWSRQSEELPLSRVHDLVTPVAAAATGSKVLTIFGPHLNMSRIGHRTVLTTTSAICFPEQ